MKQVKVLLFASLREAVGTKTLLVELPDQASVLDLKIHITQHKEHLEPLIRMAVVSVNREFAEDNYLLPHGAEVAIFPPVSGGTFPTIVAITEDMLSVDQMLTQITLPTTGATCFFTGMVRQQTTRGEQHETSFLEYEAYKPMAEAKMQQIADEIRNRWPTIEGIAIVQRIGKLYPGTPTVMIACSAAHRDTGVFDAAKYGIDRLKEIVPVWKKEVGASGQAWVEGEYYPKPGE